MAVVGDRGVKDIPDQIDAAPRVDLPGCCAI